ncbi:mammalian ependymin-related protein 1-like [Mercenaria mercenaria]|uniref:mammalian ependymin-related protein 1-like n=1 Tax=Mercenaria mercenaria TaxID=6596 RepID=UPI00234EDBF5|nr:mammalian ependymin-related protein 1-like [Mercenaria mercenaria]
MRLLIFLVAVTYLVCWADLCCFPKQWEGTLSVLMPNSSQGGLFSQDNVDISVDMTGQRIREYVRSTGTIYLMFYKEGVGYMIDNSTCSKGSVSPWPSGAVCVPGDAKLLRKYQLGIKEKMNVIDYIFITNSKTSGNMLEQTVRTVTDMCQPVEDKVMRKYSEWNSTDVYTVTYENITPGIKDPSVFNIPSTCKSSTRKVC